MTTSSSCSSRVSSSSLDDEEVDQDSALSEGYLYQHMHNEVTKVVEFESNQVEAHPRICPSRSPASPCLSCASPRHPSLPGGSAWNHHLAPVDLLPLHRPRRLQCPGDVRRSVRAGDDRAERRPVAPGPLPFNDTKSWTKDELSAPNFTAGRASRTLRRPPRRTPPSWGPSSEEWLALPPPCSTPTESSRWVSSPTSTAGSSSTPIFGSPDAVNNVAPPDIVAGAGVTRDHTQPYPVLGWVEVAWVTPIEGSGTQGVQTLGSASAS